MLFVFFFTIFGQRLVCSTSPPRGIQVDGLPRVVSKLPTANVATRDKQEIDNLRCLRGSVRKFLNITNMNRKQM